MIQNTAPTRPSTVSTLDLEQGAATQQESSTSTSGVKAACAGLATVLFAVGAGVCIVKAIQQGKEDCADNMRAVGPCPNNPPSFGLLAAGVGLAVGAIVSGCGALNLLVGKSFLDDTNTGSGRIRHHHGSSATGSGLSFGTQSAAGAFGSTGGGMGM